MAEGFRRPFPRSAAVGILSALLFGPGPGSGGAARAEGPALSVETRPETVYLEDTGSAQLVNCDFVLTNRGPEAIQINEIEVSVFDAGGKLEERRFVNNNGARPSIDVIGTRSVPPNQPQMIFNPLVSYDRAVNLTALEFTFTYSWGEHEETASVTVRPLRREAGQALLIPVRGTQLVWDGHDLYSHHRRFDYVLPMMQAFGFKSNVGRYAYDLVTIDEKGRTHVGPAEKNESWLGFGAPVSAAGAGTVVAVEDGRPDNRHMDMERLRTNHMEMFGNYVVIRHQAGEYALYGHVRQGSAVVKIGDTVRRGQQIASVGTAGSSIFPHLHFELQTTADADGEGLPSTFGPFRRVLGARVISVPRGAIDTGDIVQTDGAAAAH